MMQGATRTASSAPAPGTRKPPPDADTTKRGYVCVTTRQCWLLWTPLFNAVPTGTRPCLGVYPVYGVVPAFMERELTSKKLAKMGV